MHIELGDEKSYSAIGIGTLAFKRESGSPLHLKYVMLVPFMKMKIIYVAVLEDCGYAMIFSKGKSFLRHIDIGQVNNIGVCVKNLYKIDVEDFTALSSKVEKV